MPTKPRIIGYKQSKTIFWVQLILVEFSGLLAALSWYIGDGDWKLFSCLCAGTTAALVFRLGWLVPCVAFGTMVGLFFDPAVKGGTYESQIRETLTYICSGTIAGLVVGILATYLKRGSTG